MKKSSILEIGLFTLAVILLVMFVVLSPQYVTAGSSGLKHYEDKQISFDYPLDWAMEYYENPAARLFLPEPKVLDMEAKTKRVMVNASRNSSTNFVGYTASVSKYDELPSGITLDNAYQGQEFYVLMKNNPSYKFVSKENVNVNNLTGYKFTYEDQAYRFQEYWFTKNDKYFKLLFQIPKGNNNTTTINVVVDSFKIK